MSAGTARHKRTARGAARQHAQPRPRMPTTWGGERFRLTVRRDRGGVKLPDLALERSTTNLEWSRSGASRTGTMTVQAPVGRKDAAGLVVKGDVLRIEVAESADAAFRPYLELAVTKAVASAQAGTIECNLRSTTTQNAESRRSWRFRHDADHPRGWTARQVALAACKRTQVTPGSIAATTHHLRPLREKHGSLVEVVTRAFAEDRRETGHRYDVNLERGVLDVTPLRRPKYMLALGDLLTDAVLDDGLPSTFASAVIVTSEAPGKGKAKRKVRVKVVDTARVRRFGYVVRHTHRKGLETEAEARRYGKRWLARRAQPTDTVTVTMPGLPWVRRGDAVEVEVPVLDVTAEVYVTDDAHRLAYGSYEMDLTLAIKDPWAADEAKQRAKRKREAARRRRARAGARESSRPKSTRAKARA